MPANAPSYAALNQRNLTERAEDLVPTLKRALDDKVVTIVDRPVDYSEDLTLTHRLQEMTPPL